MEPEKKTVKVMAVVWDEKTAKKDRNEDRWIVVDQTLPEDDEARIKLWGGVTMQAAQRWCKEEDVAFKVFGANRNLRRRFERAGLVIDPKVTYYHGSK